MKKQPNAACGFCYGAWNGIDRWFMQDCVCKRACAEPKCAAQKVAQKKGSGATSEGGNP